MREMVLFHKTPASWNKPDFLQRAQLAEKSKIGRKTLEESSDLHALFASDIYIQLGVEMCKALDCSHLHIVQGFSKNERRNWISGEEEGQYEVTDKMTYWCVDSPAQLQQFMNSAIVFTRGNYASLHDFLSNSGNEGSKPIWLHYPATALMFPHLETYKEQITTLISEPTFDSRVLSEQVIGMIVEHKLNPVSGDKGLERNLENLLNHFNKRRTKQKPSPYDIVLIDDKLSFSLYQSIYSESLVVPFVKPILPPKFTINYHRKYDMMFCGTTLQATKNHLQFVGLLDRLDRETDGILRICIAGDRGDLPAFTQSLKKEYAFLEIDNYGEVARTELLSLYNQTRTLIVMSGRDCNPRIIQEAGACGVFVIATDTMSDGTEILKEEKVIGAIVPTKKDSWFYQKNGNIVFDVNTSFAQRVLRLIENAHSPYLVHEIALQRYSLEKAAEYIAEQISMLG